MPPKRRLHFPQHHLHSVIPPPTQYHPPLETPQRPQHLENPPLANLHSANLHLVNLPLAKLPPRVARRRQQVHSVNPSTTRVLYPHFHNHNPNNNKPQRPFSGNLHKERRLPPLGSPRRLVKHRLRHLLLNLQQLGRLVPLPGHPVHSGPMLRRHLLRAQEAVVVVAGFHRSLGNRLLLDSEDRARRIIHKATQDQCSVELHLDNRPTRLQQQQQRVRRRLERACLGRQHRDLDLFSARLLLLAR